ncbi:hypothetical protein CCP2SC5_1060005 [Azospirillaceae bacterium]
MNDSSIPNDASTRRCLKALSFLLPWLAILLGAPPLGVAAESGKPPELWYFHTFDESLRTCLTVKPQPEWCEAWMRTIEGARSKETDLKLPEWRRLSFKDNLRTCATLLPPPWCSEWKDLMRSLTTSPTSYQTTAHGLRMIYNAAQTETDVAHKVWAKAVERVQGDRAKPKDIELIKAKAAQGDVSAMELLAWMYAGGHGLKASYVDAYDLFGRLVMGGRTDLKENLEKLWPLLREAEKREMAKKFTAPED